MSTEPRILTCKECGTEFEHVQKGRGRPPVYCPACREARASKPKQRKIKAEVPSEGTRVIQEGAVIASGDTVVRPLKDFFKDRQTAIKYGTPLQVVSVIGDTAYVQHPAEKGPIPTLLNSLVKIVLK